MPPKRKRSVGAKNKKSVVKWPRRNLVTNGSESLEQQINGKNSQDPTLSEGDGSVVHEVQHTSQQLDLVTLTKTITESVTAAVLNNLKTLGVIPDAMPRNAVATAPSSTGLSFPAGGTDNNVVPAGTICSSITSVSNTLAPSSSSCLGVNSLPSISGPQQVTDYGC